MILRFKYKNDLRVYRERTNYYALFWRLALTFFLYYYFLLVDKKFESSRIELMDHPRNTAILGEQTQ
jgi:hypothetical protein